MDLTNRIAAPQIVVRAYGRASTLKQVMSPLQQEAACKDAFDLYKRIKTGWVNAEWGGFFFDEATSRTSKFHERPMGSLLVATSKPGDIIMAANFDRIFANVLDVCETLELVETRKFKLTILDADIDISSDIGQMAFQMFALVKNLEVKAVRRRGRDAAAHRIANGMPWGQSPVGWKTKCFKNKKGGFGRRYVANNEDRALAKLVLDLRVVQELSYREIADELRSRRIRCPRGKGWAAMTVRRWANAALHNFPLKNGSHTPAPLPPDAAPIDSIFADN